MKSASRGVFPAAALAALLAASGCDYWKNLTEGKSVDHGLGIRIAVRDAWTREPVQVVCRDAGQDFSRAADGSGLINAEGVGTGPYSLNCADPDSDYFQANLSFHIGPQGSFSDTLRMARKGGGHWFDDLERRAEIFFPETTTFRVPTTLSLRATPADTGGIFRYEWSPVCLPSAPPGSRCDVRMDSADHGDQTFQVKIFATPPGFSEYEVGTVLKIKNFAADIPPTLLAYYDSLQTVVVNCRDPSFNVGIIEASDSDGTCEGVTITSLDSNSALGKLRIDTTCLMAGVISLPIARQLNGPKTSYFKVEARDDNGVVTDTVLKYKTISVPGPVIRPPKVRARQFFGYQFSARITVTDQSSDLDSLRINWGDSTKTAVDFHGDQTNIETDTTTLGTKTVTAYHTYHHDLKTPNPFVLVEVTNACGVSTNGTFRLEVADNSLPTADIQFRGYTSPTTAEIEVVNATDPDLNFDADSLTLTVNWDDIPFAFQTKQFPVGRNIEHFLLSHDYQKHGPDSAQVAVQVWDGHGTHVTRIIPIPRPP